MSEKNKSDMLRAPFKLEYDYERSTGPIIGKFFEGLSNQQILGTKNGDNVYVPAAEFDPITYEHLSEFVELPETGTVKSFTWIDQPRKHHLINKPFAFALIQIDGATSSILHMITNCNESDIEVGSRVKVSRSEEKTETIKDISHFELINE